MPEQLQTIPPTPGFKEQFQTIRQIESQGGNVKFVDIAPEVLDDEIPVIVAGGWGLGPKAYESTAKVGYESGRRMLLMEHSRSGKPQSENASAPDEELQKAHSLVEVLKASGVEKTDVIAHSEGTIYTVLAALEHPELFRSIVFTGPAGMVGQDTTRQLVRRFGPVMGRSLTKDMWHNPRAGLATGNDITKHVIKNPAKSLREIKDMAATRIDHVLGGLRQNGIKVGILQWNADRVFPPDRIEEHVVIEGINRVTNGENSDYVVDPTVVAGNVDAYASVITKKAGHGDLQINPGVSTAAALNLLKDFRKDIERENPMQQLQAVA